MKLSIVIICWNDLKVIMGCLQSIFGQKHETEFEVIVSDNGSADGSVEWIRTNFPQVRIMENGAKVAPPNVWGSVAQLLTALLLSRVWRSRCPASCVPSAPSR